MQRSHQLKAHNTHRISSIAALWTTSSVNRLTVPKLSSFPQSSKHIPLVHGKQVVRPMSEAPFHCVEHPLVELSPLPVQLQISPYYYQSADAM